MPFFDPTTKTRRAALALSIAFVSLSPLAYADDWAMGFHDSRHTGQTSEVVTPPLSLAWTWKDTLTYDTGDGGKFYVQPFFWLPLYYQGNVYLQGGNNANRVFCLNPANGAKVWEWDNPNYAQAGTYLFQFNNYPAAVSGRILNATSDYSTSLDAATGGNAQTTYNTNGGWPYGGAAVWNNMAYMQYLRADDGTEAFHVVQDPVNWVLVAPYAYYSPDDVVAFTDSSMRVPTVDNYTAYVNILSDLAAFDATTGWPIWVWGKMDYDSSPAVSNGVVYFYATNLGEMVALNAAGVTYPSSGTEVPILWSVSMPKAYSPIVSGGILYVGGGDGNFYALNAATGATEWTFQTGKAFTSLQIPAISGNLIYVPGADGTLYVLQKSNGAEVWHYTGTAAWGPVVIAGGMVFASDLTNTFYAFQPQTAAIGPSVTALSIPYAPNNAAATVNLTGSGFFAGGTDSAVQSVYLDNSAGTILTGYTVTGDQSITGVVIPVGLAPGVYHIKVQTTVGPTANEPAFTVEPANSINISTLGYSNGPVAVGTNYPLQRHLIRTSNGTLLTVYMGPVANDTQYPTYNFSFDGGLTWSGQSQLALSNQGTIEYAPTSSIWVDPQDQLNIVSIQAPSYNEVFQKFALNNAGVLTQDTGFPVYPAGGTATNAVLNSDIPGPLVAEPGGRLWLTYQSAANSAVLAYYSDNGGLNWTAAGQINVAAGSPPVMVLYKGYPAVIYTDGANLAWSAWNGTSWSAPQTLPGPVTGVTLSLSAVTTSDGQVHVVYSPAKGGVYYTAYAGQSWSLPAVLDAAGTTPSITTDGTNLWVFYANSGGNLVYRQTSNGLWNAAVAVTNDGNQNTTPATLPLSPSGQIPVVWTSGTSAAGYFVKAAVITNGAAAGPPVPVLTVTMTNGSFSQGQSGATYTVTVSNAASAGPTSGTVTATVTVPAGLTLVSLSGSGWACNGATCTRSDPLGGGSIYPAITVTVNVAANAAASLTSEVSVSGGGSATATASDVTSISAGPALKVTMTNTGTFSQGQSGATYTVTVGNAASAGPTSGTVTVTVAVPAGLTLVSLSGSGWACTGATCTRSDPLGGGSVYPGITVTVNVAANAPASLTSQVSVSGGGSATATASDVTSISAGPALKVTMTNAGSFSQGQSAATYAVTVSNASTAGPTSGTVTATVTVPTGLTLLSLSGSGWACTGATCTRSDPLGGGSIYPAITVTVNVAGNAPASLTSQVSVSGGGSATATASDVTSITAGPALKVTMTNAGSFSQGQSEATYTVTVSNTAAAGPTSGTVTTTVTVPAGLTLVSLAGTGWACTGAICTRSDPLGGGSVYPAITVTVNVAANASASLTSQVSVSGGGSATATASDLTTITASPALKVTMTNAGAFSQGQNGATYTVTVSNAAAASTTGTVTATVTVPAGLTLVSLSGGGWACTGATCTRSDPLGSGLSYPAITVTVNVAGNAPSSLTSQVTVSGGGSATATASDITSITTSPTLTVTMTNAGSFSLGQSGATYSVTVSNAAAAAPTTGTVTVTVTEPTGLTLVSLSGSGWACTGATCTRSDPLGGGSSYPAITVTVNVAANAPTNLTSQVTVSGGGSATATASDITSITTGPALTVTMTNAGSFTLGQSGETYTVTVSNATTASPTTGTVTVTVTEPTGLTLVSMSGTGWACGGAGCTRSDPLGSGLSYPPITVTVNVAANTSSPLTSRVSVSGGGSPTATASDVTTIGGSPALKITMTNAAGFTQGQNGATYTVTVSNPTTAGQTSGTVTVTDSEPAGLTLISMAGSGWSCSSTCTRSDALAGGLSYPPITVTVNVAANAPASLTSQASVSGGGSATATATDVTSIISACLFTAPASVALTNAVPASGTPATQTFSFAVTPSTGCKSSTTWTAATGSADYWLTISGASGNGGGSATIQGSGLSNTETSVRTGTITITPSAGSAVAVQVTQPPSPATTPLIDLEVTTLYQTVLGRDPDSTGYNFWTGAGTQGLGDMFDAFVTSPEAYNSDFAVMAAYQAATGSAPTYTQFRAAVVSVQTGAQTVDGLFSSLTGSGYTATSLYQNLLGRAPSSSEISQANTAGLIAWFETLIGFPTAVTPVAAVDNEFQSTGTFANLTSAAGDHTNGLYIRLLYFTILLRDPDPAGLNFWQGVANAAGAGILFQGAATYNVRIQIEGPDVGQGFTGSPEFQALY